MRVRGSSGVGGCPQEAGWECVSLPPPTPTCCCRTWVVSDPACWVGQGKALGRVGQAFGILLARAPFSHSSAPCPQELLLAPALLEQLTCMPGSRELGRVLTVPRGQQTALQGYRDAVCRGQAAARAHRFSGLAAELRNQLDAAKIAQQVRPARQPACRSVTWARGCARAPRERLGPGLCLAVLGSPAPGLRSSLSSRPWLALLDPQAAPLLASCVSCGCPPHSMLTSASPADSPQTLCPPLGLSLPTALFPLSWAWMLPMALPPHSNHHPHHGCRHSWRTCWMPRRSCGTWMSSQPLPCCCLRAPAQAGLLGPQPVALAGRPTALGLGQAPAPTARLRRGPRPLQPRPPRTHCRASAPLSCSSGPACSPSCVATTGRWVAGGGVRKPGVAGPAPRPGSDAPSLVLVHGPLLHANCLTPAPIRKPRAHPSLPMPHPTSSLACLPQHHRA